MKIKLKFDRDELKGFITILQNLSKNILGGITYDLYRSELVKMYRKYISNMIENTNKKKFPISLTDYQTVILWQLLNECCDNFQPFEKGISLRVIAELDRQYMNYQQVLRNFSNQI
jgi:hypothetical protein